MDEKKSSFSLSRIFGSDATIPFVVIPIVERVAFPNGEVQVALDDLELVEYLKVLWGRRAEKAPEVLLATILPGRERAVDENSFFHIGTVVRLDYPVQIVEYAPAEVSIRFRALGFWRAQIVDFVTKNRSPHIANVRPLPDAFGVTLKGSMNDIARAYRERVRRIGDAYEDVLSLMTSFDEPAMFVRAYEYFIDASERGNAEEIDRSIFGSRRNTADPIVGLIGTLQNYTAQERRERTIRTIGPLQDMLECVDPIRRLDLVIQFLLEEIKARKEIAAKPSRGRKIKGEAPPLEKGRTCAELVRVLIFDRENSEKKGG